eukprot:1357492-Prymnesium_polylepis.1
MFDCSTRQKLPSSGSTWTNCLHRKSPSQVKSSRPAMPKLPPWVQLSREALQEKTLLTRPGEWYGLPFPTTLAEITDERFGAPWLTEAMHTAGTLPHDN